MSTIDHGRTGEGLEWSVLWRSVAAIALAGAVGATTLAGTGGVAAADPDPAPRAHRPAAKPHHPVKVDIRGVSQPAYIKVVRLPDVAPRRAAAHSHRIEAQAPAHHPARRAHPRPRAVVRCQQDDTDQTADFGDDTDEPTTTVNPATSGNRCPSARDGFDLNRLLGFRSAPRAQTRTPG